MIFGEDQVYTVPGPDGEPVLVRALTSVMDGDDVYVALVQTDEDGEFLTNEDDELELSFVALKMLPVEDEAMISHLLELVQEQMDELEGDD